MLTIAVEIIEQGVFFAALQVCWPERDQVLGRANVGLLGEVASGPGAAKDRVLWPDLLAPRLWRNLK
jgi:hypothetical protein